MTRVGPWQSWGTLMEKNRAELRKLDFELENAQVFETPPKRRLGNDTSVQSVFKLASFSFMRCGEFTINSTCDYDKVIRIEDVVITG